MTPSLLALTLVLSGSPAAYPEVLSRPLLAKVDPFIWPRPSNFTTQWDQAKANDQGRVVLRLERNGLSGWYVASHEASEYGKWRLTRIVGDRDTRFTDSIGTGAVSGEVLTTYAYDRSTPQTVTVAERLEGTVPVSALAPFTYVKTLLDSNGALYADQPDGRDGELRSLIDTTLNGKDADIAAWAAKNKGDDALYERFRHYRPVGECSMDEHPQEAARAFAELAYVRGDLGRFLHLQLNIMGDRFDRTASSSYGERAHATQAERLLTTGIDLESFLLGAIVATADRGPELGAWRLARSIQETKLEATMLPRFEALMTSADLDAYNRLLATQVWFFTQVRDQGPKRRNEKARASAEQHRKDVIARSLTLSLHPLAKAWLSEP